MKPEDKKMITVTPEPSASISELAEYRRQCQQAIAERSRGTSVVRSLNIPAVRIYGSETRGINPGTWK